MIKYLRKKILFYLLTFFVAVTINWMIPRLMPGDPVKTMLAKYRLEAEARKKLEEYINSVFGFDKPLPVQYLNYWKNLIKGDLGMSLKYAPKPVIALLLEGIPFSLIVVIPALFISYFIGNRIGALAARKKKIDNFLLPIMYTVTAMPYMWFGVILIWFLGVLWHLFPYAFAYRLSIVPNFSLDFILDFLYHWVLPFLTLFTIQLGGWAIGMRNMIIYELESNYSRYLECLGAPKKLIRKYAYKNAILPQVTGLGLMTGQLIAGNILVEIVFQYPGIGRTILRAVNNSDYFVLQGCFLVIIIAVLLANFIVDLVYIFIDPRVRYSYGGGK